MIEHTIQPHNPMKYNGEGTRQRDVSDQKQDSSIQIAILRILMQS